MKRYTVPAAKDLDRMSLESVEEIIKVYKEWQDSHEDEFTVEIANYHFTKLLSLQKYYEEKKKREA